MCTLLSVSDVRVDRAIICVLKDDVKHVRLSPVVVMHPHQVGMLEDLHDLGLVDGILHRLLRLLRIVILVCGNNLLQAVLELGRARLH